MTLFSKNVGTLPPLFVIAYKRYCGFHEKSTTWIPLAVVTTDATRQEQKGNLMKKISCNEQMAKYQIWKKL